MHNNLDALWQAGDVKRLRAGHSRSLVSPHVTEGRASLNVKDKSLSQVVIDGRKETRYR